MEKAHWFGRRRVLPSLRDVSTNDAPPCFMHSQFADCQLPSAGAVRQTTEAMSTPNTVILQRALVLCAVAVPVVGFNVFASAHQNEAILYWSLAITAIFTLLGSAFVLWATNILWPATAKAIASD